VNNIDETIKSLVAAARERLEAAALHEKQYGALRNAQAGFVAAASPAMMDAQAQINAILGSANLSQDDAAQAARTVDQLGNVIANAVADLAPQSSASAATASGAATRTAPIKELDVQLNPASLGNLTIEMRLSEGKLAITIKAAKSDTLKLIDGERGSISDKLASLNFTVESVTVKSADAPAASAPGTNASNSGMASNGGAQQNLSGQGGDAQSGGSLRSGQQQSAPQPRDAFVEPGGVNSFGDLVV